MIDLGFQSVTQGYLEKEIRGQESPQQVHCSSVVEHPN